MGTRKGQIEEDTDMVNPVRGDERRGQDDDEGKGSNVRVVQIENAYHEKLRARLGQGTDRGPAPATGDPGSGGIEPGPAPAGPVIYNDDGSIFKRPSR